jgi:hypothetical protein
MIGTPITIRIAPITSKKNPLEALLLRAQLLLAERPVRAHLGEALERVAACPPCPAMRVS